MTSGVMGQKDWDEYLSKKESEDKVVYNTVEDYKTVYMFFLEELMYD